MNIRGTYRARMLARRLRSRVTRQAAILLYHRVADAGCDPWSLCVSPRNFAQHLDVLAKHHHVVSFAGLPQALQRRRATQHPVVITFDDGYADNLHTAVPLLDRWGVPATIFVSTGWVGQSEFWWDGLERLLFEPVALPSSLRLFVSGAWHHWSLADSEADINPDRASGNDRDADRKLRHSLHLSIYELLCPLTHLERARVLDDLRGWARAEPDGRPANGPLNPDELQDLARCELIEIGAHTMSHSRLARLPVSQQRAEIEGSKTFLEDAVNRPVSSFAYPFGKRADYTRQTVSLVRNAGFARACSNFPGPVRSATERYQLPRFCVTDCDGDEFSRRLTAWLAGVY